MGEVGSARFDMNVQFQLGGLDIPTVFSGSLQLPDRIQGRITASVLGDGEVTFVGDNRYFKDLGTGEWVEITGRGPSVADPGKIVGSALSMARNVTLMDADTLRGATVHHLAGVTSPAAFGASGGQIEFELWIGAEDARLRKVVLQGDVDMGETPDSVLGGMVVGVLPVSLTLELSEFGQQVSIESPIKDQAPGNMRWARMRHTATPLENGAVLIAGGSDTVQGSLGRLRSAKTYDPVSNT